MVDFFPLGFWKIVAMGGMVLLFAIGIDLLLGARVVVFLSQWTNRKFHVDQVVVRALADLKKNSDREYDMEHSLLHSWGRFIASGILLAGAVLMAVFLMPRLS